MNMKITKLITGALLIGGSLGANEVITQPQMIPLDKNDSAEQIIKQAASVRPHARQLSYHQEEFTAFIHYGINTFTGRQWGSGKEQPTAFNPSVVDTDQWCKVMKAAGMKKVMMTIKHHDGFCLWQTRYNDKFSVKASPWMEGKGDVLKLLADSARKYGLRLGVYISPADLYQIENNDGLYGNLSKYQDTIIPTDPASFQTEPTKQRQVPADYPTFKVKADDYNRYMMNQLYEVLTEYGPVHEVWFDGAHPKRKGGQKYIKIEWFKMVRTLQPQAVIFGGPDARWCGNEHGGTRESEWSVIPVESLKVIGLDRTAERLGDDASLTSGGYSVYGRKYKNNVLAYIVCEVDVSIRDGWFWNSEHQHVRSAEDVYDMYERSVGNNSVFLLNVPPNRDGVLPPRDTKVLLEVGKRIKSTYGTEAADLQHVKPGIYNFNQAAVINRCVIMEDVAAHGQQVKKHALDAWIDGAWKEVATATTIGYKRILRFPDVKTDKIRVRILEQRSTAKILKTSVHYDPAPLKTPIISRNREGRVTIKGNKSIFYTLDGSEPGRSSTAYTGPFPLPKGGTVKAVALSIDEKSEVITQRFDISKVKWKIHHVSSHQPSGGEGADKAIDDDPKTLWHSKWNGADPHPHSLTIDLGEELDLKGFSYLPRVGGIKSGILDQYKVELSQDGKKWLKASEGRFDNIQNNPTQREVRFERTFPRVRYLKFIGVHSIQNEPDSSAAEVGVITR